MLQRLWPSYYFFNLTRLNLAVEQKSVEKHFFSAKEQFSEVSNSLQLCLLCVLTRGVGFSYKQGWPMCFERGTKYQIWFLKINFPVFWLVTGINLWPLANYSPLLWSFLICGKILLYNNFTGGSKPIGKRMTLGIFIVSERINLVGCILLNSSSKLLSKNSKPGNSENFS